MNDDDLKSDGGSRQFLFCARRDTVRRTFGPSTRASQYGGVERRARRTEGPSYGRWVWISRTGVNM